MIKKVFHSILERGISSYSHDGRVLELVEGKIADPVLAQEVSACSGGWSVDPEFARVLALAIELSGCRNVLEFGAGTSSVVIATALESAGGGKLTSIEQDPGWCREKWALVQQKQRVNAKMLTGFPARAWSRLGPHYTFWKLKEEVATRGPFDLVVVDAPQFFFGREGAVPLVHDLLAEGALILLDDAERNSEKWAVWQWLHSFPGLRLAFHKNRFGEKGIAILRLEKKIYPVFSLKSFLIGTYTAFQRWKHHRKTQAELSMSRPMANELFKA